MLSLIKSKKTAAKEKEGSGGSTRRREKFLATLTGSGSGERNLSSRENSLDRGLEPTLEQVQPQTSYQQQPRQTGRGSEVSQNPGLPEFPSTLVQPEPSMMRTPDVVADSTRSAAAAAAFAPERPPSRSGDRPSSRSSGYERPSSRNSDRPSSRNGRSRQPRLGTSPLQQSPYLFEDDPGIMSEVETSSTRFRKTSMGKEKNSRVGSGSRARTSPGSQAPKGFYPGEGGRHRTPRDALPPPPGLNDDDSGIMSEAETSSTTRSSKRRSRNSIPMGSLSLGGRSSGHQHGGKQKYRPGVSSTLFEEDPGIMSEAETASTSSKIRRHQKPALPVVRTPSKTLERPLGIVFLIYRGETKRALLPNEITSIITVKALFVRSFSKTLTLDYMDSPRVKIYIHDSAKDIFNELQDLSEIKDRAILKVFEPDASGRGPGGLGASGLPPITNSEELTSVPNTNPAALVAEPEYVDSRYVKANKIITRAQKELENSYGLKANSTLPRNAFSSLDSSGSSNSGTGSTTVPPSEGVMRLGERSKTLGPGFMRGHRFGNGNSSSSGGSTGSRVESGYVSSPDGNYELFEAATGNRAVPTSRFSMAPPGRYYPGPANTEEAKARMMHMEAQLSQLTGMVEKALKNKKLSGKKQVSFDKSVTFSDDQPPSILKKHANQRQSQQPHYHHHHNQQQQPQQQVQPYNSFSPEMHGQLKRLGRSTRELKQEVRVLRRLTQLQSMAMKDLVQDTYLKLREACISFSSQNGLISSADNLEHWRIAQDEETFARELTELLQAIAELEAKVEEVRSGVINKKNKIPLQDVEGMTLALSKASKKVTQLRQAFPMLEANLKGPGENAKIGKKETEFLKKSFDRLDNAWRRCKKLTGTLVTLKRLASVQEQRFHPGSSSSGDISLSPTPSETSSSRPSSSSRDNSKENSLDDLLDALQTYTSVPTSLTQLSSDNQPKKDPAPAPPPSNPAIAKVRPQSHLLPSTSTSSTTPTSSSSSPVSSSISSPLKKLQSNGDVVKKTPPCPPPRTTPSISTSTKGAPPPPPPRTSSTKPNEPTPSSTGLSAGNVLSRAASEQQAGESESSLSIGSGPGLKKAHSVNGPNPPAVAPKPDLLKGGSTNGVTARQDVLETRHQELLTRQKQLQEQYQRLQEMQKKNNNGKNGNNNNNNNGDVKEEDEPVVHEEEGAKV